MKKALVFAGLVLLSFLPFTGIFQASFVWDDYDLIVNNPVIREWSAGNLFKIFTQTHMGLYAPLVYFSFAVEHLFFKLDPFIYHLDNVLLHVLNVLAVFIFARTLKVSQRAAFMIAAFFAVHPAHVESVAWISQRKDVLYAVFFWLSATFYIKRHRFISLLCFAASLLSKPMAVTLPLVLLAYEFIFEVPREGRVKRLAPFFVMAGVTALATLFAFQGEGGIRPFVLSPDLILLPSYSVLFYIEKIFWPFNLSAFYAFPKAKDLLYLSSPLWAGLACFTVFMMAKRHRECSFGGAFFFITLLPVLQFVPVGNTFAADRYLYVAMFGPFFSLVCIGSTLAKKAKSAQVLGCIFVTLVIGVWTWQSRERVEVWRDDTTLWGDVLKKNPTSSLAYYNRGRFYHVNGKLTEAMADYDEALRLNPWHAGAQKNRGVVFGMMGEFAKARDCFDQVLRIYPKDAEAYYNRGVAYAMMGDYRQSVADFQTALALKPDHPDAKARLDVIAPLAA